MRIASRSRWGSVKDRDRARARRAAGFAVVDGLRRRRDDRAADDGRDRRRQRLDRQGAASCWLTLCETFPMPIRVLMIGAGLGGDGRRRLRPDPPRGAGARPSAWGAGLRGSRCRRPRPAWASVGATFCGPHRRVGGRSAAARRPGAGCRGAGRTGSAGPAVRGGQACSPRLLKTAVSAQIARNASGTIALSRCVEIHGTSPPSPLGLRNSGSTSAGRGSARCCSCRRSRTASRCRPGCSAVGSSR